MANRRNNSPSGAVFIDFFVKMPKLAPLGEFGRQLASGEQHDVRRHREMH
jgi:hypothetical protein